MKIVQRAGILTTGGDAPCLNAAIRADGKAVIVRCGIRPENRSCAAWNPAPRPPGFGLRNEASAARPDGKNSHRLA